MVMPAAEANIHIAADGGNQAAAELEKPSAAMQQMGNQHKKMSQEFAKGVKTTGLISMGREMSKVAGNSTAMTTGITNLMTTLKLAMAGVGGLAVALPVLAAALGVAKMAWDEFGQRAESAAKALQESNMKLLASVKAFDDSGGAAAALTKAQSKLIKSTKELQGLEFELLQETTELTAQQKEATARGEGWLITLKKLSYFILGDIVDQRKLTLEMKRAGVEADELRAGIQALTLRYENINEMLARNPQLVNDSSAALSALTDEAVKSEARLAALDPKQKYELELKGIERVRQVRKHAYGEAIAAEREFLRQIADLLKKRPVEREKILIKLRDLEAKYAQGRVAINQTAANDVAIAWESESKRIAAATQAAAIATAAAWNKATAGMRSVMSTTMNKLVSDVRQGTVTAASLFETMADAIAKVVTQMMMQQAMTKATTGAVGGFGGGGGGFGFGGGGGIQAEGTGGLSSGAGLAIVGAVSAAIPALMGGGAASNVTYYHHGGRVPAPRGEERLAVVRGGERITSGEGRGGPMGGEGGKTINVTFRQGILTADSVRQAMRSISGTIGSVGDRAFPRR